MSDLLGLGVCRWPFTICATLVLPRIVRSVRAQGSGWRRAGAHDPRTMAPFDPTGYWVAIISEDWRWRMATPAKGDFPAFLSRDGQRRLPKRGSREDNPRRRAVSGVWGARADAGHVDCTSHGRTTTRSAGKRLRHADAPVAIRQPAVGPGRQEWQACQPPNDYLWRRPRAGAGARIDESVTTQLRPATCERTGFLQRQHGLHGYWDLHTEANGDQYPCRYQYRRGPRLSPGSVGYRHPLQEGTQRQQVGSFTLRREF